MAEEKKPLPLAEIVTGVIIIIILIVYALPRLMNWTEGSAIDNEASKLYYNLEAAKNTAAKNNHHVWVEFQGTSGYTIYEDVNGNDVRDSGEPTRRIKLSPEIQFGINLDPPTQNVWGIANISRPIEFVGDTKKFYFERNGKASSTGAVYIIAKKDVGHNNDDVRAVKILGAAGDITVMRYFPDQSPPWK